MRRICCCHPHPRLASSAAVAAAVIVAVDAGTMATAAAAAAAAGMTVVVVVAAAAAADGAAAGTRIAGCPSQKLPFRHFSMDLAGRGPEKPTLGRPLLLPPPLQPTTYSSLTMRSAAAHSEASRSASHSKSWALIGESNESKWFISSAFPEIWRVEKLVWSCEGWVDTSTAMI